MDFSKLVDLHLEDKKFRGMCLRISLIVFVISTFFTLAEKKGFVEVSSLSSAFIFSLNVIGLFGCFFYSETILSFLGKHFDI